jgi:DNA-directed RNA polymerase subunit alpha
MENFLLPSKVEFQDGPTPHSGAVVVMPCYHGYGTTLGNAFRRVLLSSLPGAAVEYFKIRGVQHEFSAVEGVQEDVMEIMLNLKQLVVKVFVDDPVTLQLTKKGSGPVTAGDITPNSSVEIVNKDLVIATLTGNKALDMEIVVGRGRGYKPVEEKDKKNYDLGTIVVDSVYTPIRDVGYRVEYTRVGDITNYEKLTITIETNGTITPQEAVRQSTEILMNHFTIVLETANREREQAAPSVAEVTPPTEMTEEEPVSNEEESEVESKKKTVKKAKKK